MANADSAAKADPWRIEVNFHAPGPFTSAEEQALEHWYKTAHGDGDLKINGFVDFWLSHRSIVMKHWRRFINDCVATQAVPMSVIGLTMLHTYTVLGYPDGAHYEILSTLKFGGSRQQVLDAMALGFLHAGPKNMTSVAAQCSAYLDKVKNEPEVPAQWPEGWAVDPAAFRSGLDFSTRTLSADEYEALEAWYRASQGEVPSYVPFMAKWNPAGFKSHRQRYEAAITVLPKQIVPLFMFNVAAIQGQPEPMRRAAYQARAYGVTREQIMCLQGAAMAYTGDNSTSLVADVLGPLFEDWESDRG